MVVAEEAALGTLPADTIGHAQVRALQRMRAEAVVDSARAVLVISDDSLSPNPETGRTTSPLDSVRETDPDAPETGFTPAVSEPPPGAFGELRFAAALFDDFQLGGRLGAEIADPGLPLDLFFDLEARPISKAVRVRASEILEYQFQEHRFTPSLGIMSRFPLGSQKADFWTFGGGAGISFGYYRGSNRSAEVTFPVWVETGFRFELSRGSYVGMAYQYFPLPSASPHRLTLVYGLRGPGKGER